MKKEINQLDEQETESIFRIETSWERKGRYEGKIEVAQRMLKQGISVEDVIRFTDLSEKEIEKLRKTAK